MRIAGSLLVVLIAMFAGLCFGDAGTGKKPAKSADGVELPSPSPLALKGELPVIRGLIGSSLQDLPQRIFSADKSADLLRRRCKRPVKCDWFIWGPAGADVVAIKLADGRVAGVTLVFNSITPERLKSLRDQFSRAADPANAQVLLQGTLPVFINVIHYMADQNGPAEIHLQANAAEWYILLHSPPEPIKAAMRSRKIVQGMTEEQIKVLFGEPHERQQRGTVVRAVWQEYRPARRAGGVRTGKLEDIWMDAQRAALNDDKELSKEFRVTLADGRVTDVSEWSAGQ